LTGEINNTGAAIMTNAKTSYRAGIELVSYYQPVKFFLWKINSTFSTNKILNYTEFIDDWDTGVQRQKAIGLTNISFSPNIILTNELHFTIIKKIKISAITKFVSKQYLDNSSNDNYILKPYSTTNLNFSYQLQCKAISQIEFFFYINNIFNTRYESNAWLYRYYEEGIEKFQDGYFAQAGINVLGGIKMRF
jgi:iron complex outermembrane receptor protein